jgi:hypothetical protein
MVHLPLDIPVLPIYLAIAAVVRLVGIEVGL